MKALDHLNGKVCWDYRIVSFDGWILRLVGGTNLAYPDSHSIEIEFHGTVYLACPTDFSHARFRHATETERQSINLIIALEPEQTVFVIEAEATGRCEMQSFFVVAESISSTERPQT